MVNPSMHINEHISDLLALWNGYMFVENPAEIMEALEQHMNHFDYIETLAEYTELAEEEEIDNPINLSTADLIRAELYEESTNDS